MNLEFVLTSMSNFRELFCFGEQEITVVESISVDLVGTLPKSVVLWSMVSEQMHT